MRTYFILLLFICGALTENRPIVTTNNGAIRGVYRLSTNGRRFAAFEGVPYAQPPIGELRFREPQTKQPWTGVWDATNVYQCTQINHEPNDLGHVEGTEDCLYVNIYSPAFQQNGTVRDKLLDVIVHFHSGAFMWGRGDIYGAYHLMDRDVVYLNLNYRLGPLGFLSTEDDVLPGNNGLKDQVMALKWIQGNIKQFGGNPESVTLTGLSAGGASTHYHFLSPLSRGLFHRGISVSGTAFVNWALTENHLEKALKLGSIVGCEQRVSQELVTCLRERSAQQITQTVKHFQPWLYNPYSPFGPTVERNSSARAAAFLPDTPYNLLKQGQAADVPWITSVTSEEGLYPAAQFIFNDTWLPYLNEHWLEIAPYIFHYDSTVPKNKMDGVSQQIKDFYLKGQPISRKSYPQLVQAIGDRLFVVDSEKAARLQAKVNKSPVYYYRFSYRGDHSYSEYFTGTTENVGVSHADDLMYIMSPDKSWFSKYLQSEQDKKMSKILIDMWMSFIKTGKPEVPSVSQWQPVSKEPSEPLRYVHIASPDNIVLKTASSLGYGEFWNSLSFLENDKLVINNDEL